MQKAHISFAGERTELRDILNFLFKFIHLQSNEFPDVDKK